MFEGFLIARSKQLLVGCMADKSLSLSVFAFEPILNHKFHSENIEVLISLKLNRPYE